MSEPIPKKGPERKRWVVEQLKAGAKQTDLARRMGVSRQAISLIWKSYREHGESYLRKSGRRPRETDTLSKSEKEAFVGWLRENDPAATGETEEHWSLYSVKRAIRRRLGKSVKVSVAFECLWSAFPEGPPTPVLPPPDLMDTEEADDEASGDDPDPFPYKPDKADEEHSDLPSLEEMEKINRETLEGKEFSGLPTRPESPGMRTGKHSKGKKNPRPKPKRRRKRR